MRMLIWSLVLAGPLLSQEEAVPWLDNYPAAIQEARRTGKPLFLEFRCEP